MASRLRTIKSATRCAGTLSLVLEDGRVVERDTHRTPLAHGGAYARLYHLQLRDQEEFAARTLAGSGRRGVAR